MRLSHKARRAIVHFWRMRNHDKTLSDCFEECIYELDSIFFDDDVYYKLDLTKKRIIVMGSDLSRSFVLRVGYETDTYEYTTKSSEGTVTKRGERSKLQDFISRCSLGF